MWRYLSFCAALTLTTTVNAQVRECLPDAPSKSDWDSGVWDHPIIVSEFAITQVPVECPTEGYISDADPLYTAGVLATHFWFRLQGNEGFISRMPARAGITIELYKKNEPYQFFVQAVQAVHLDGAMVKSHVLRELNGKRTGPFNVPTELYFDWRGAFYLRSMTIPGSYVIRLQIDGSNISCRNDHIASCDCDGGQCGIAFSIVPGSG